LPGNGLGLSALSAEINFPFPFLKTVLKTNKIVATAFPGFIQTLLYKKT